METVLWSYTETQGLFKDIHLINGPHLAHKK